MKLEGHEGPVSAISLLSNYEISSFIISASSDCSLIVWGLENGQIIHKLLGHKLNVKALSVSSQDNK